MRDSVVTRRPCCKWAHSHLAVCPPRIEQLREGGIVDTVSEVACAALCAKRTRLRSQPFTMDELIDR